MSNQLGSTCSTVPNGAAHLGDQHQSDQRGDHHVVPDQPVTSMDAFGVAETLAGKAGKSRHECVLPLMLFSRDLMYTLGGPDSVACMQQGLFAVGAACHSEAQLADVVAYLVEDSLFGPYIQQMGKAVVYSTLLRSYNSCNY